MQQMSLVDRAARALAVSRSDLDDWDALGEMRQEQLRKAVRAALKTLRDPDDRMMEAGAEIVRNVGPAESEFAYRNDAANTWRFMIDALLREGE